MRRELALDRLALDRQRHLLAAGRPAATAAMTRADLGRRADEVVDQRVDRLDAVGPAAVDARAATRARSCGPRGRSTRASRCSSLAIRAFSSTSSLTRACTSPMTSRRRAGRRTLKSPSRAAVERARATASSARSSAVPPRPLRGRATVGPALLGRRRRTLAAGSCLGGHVPSPWFGAARGWIVRGEQRLFRRYAITRNPWIAPRGGETSTPPSHRTADGTFGPVAAWAGRVAQAGPARRRWGRRSTSRPRRSDVPCRGPTAADRIPTDSSSAPIEAPEPREVGGEVGQHRRRAGQTADVLAAGGQLLHRGHDLGDTVDAGPGAGDLLDGLARGGQRLQRGDRAGEQVERHRDLGEQLERRDRGGEAVEHGREIAQRLEPGSGLGQRHEGGLDPGEPLERARRPPPAPPAPQRAGAGPAGHRA